MIQFPLGPVEGLRARFRENQRQAGGAEHSRGWVKQVFVTTVLKRPPRAHAGFAGFYPTRLRAVLGRTCAGFALDDWRRDATVTPRPVASCRALRRTSALRPLARDPPAAWRFVTSSCACGSRYARSGRNLPGWDQAYFGACLGGQQPRRQMCASRVPPYFFPFFFLCCARCWRGAAVLCAGGAVEATLSAACGSPQVGAAAPRRRHRVLFTTCCRSEERKLNEVNNLDIGTKCIGACRPAPRCRKLSAGNAEVGCSARPPRALRASPGRRPALPVQRRAGVDERITRD